MTAKKSAPLSKEEVECRKIIRRQDRELAELQAEVDSTAERLRVLLEVYWAADWVLQTMMHHPQANARLTAGVAAAKKVLDKRAAREGARKGAQS